MSGTRRHSATGQDPWSPYPGECGWSPTPLLGAVVQRAWSRSAHRQRGHEASTRPVAAPRRGAGTGSGCAVRAGAAKRTHDLRPRSGAGTLDQGRRGSCAVPLRRCRSRVSTVPPPSVDVEPFALGASSNPPPVPFHHPASPLRRPGPAARPTLPPSDAAPPPAPSRPRPVPVQHLQTDPDSASRPGQNLQPARRARTYNGQPGRRGRSDPAGAARRTPWRCALARP
ncbi:hypothetical protein FHX58_004420 [Paraburkholderia tropica]|nr:hypothetical protein [Paraburkholderia tropica]